MLHLSQMFNGPIHQAFVYSYYQTYTQDVDMYTYSIQNKLDVHFTHHEKLSLMSEKRPQYLTLLQLYKIMKVCCNPVLAPFGNQIWTELHYDDKKEKKVEHLLNFIIQLYQDFLRSGPSTSAEECCNQIKHLGLIVQQLVEVATQNKGNNRWKEEQKNLESQFEEIEKHIFCKEETSIASMLRIELHLQCDRLCLLLPQVVAHSFVGEYQFLQIHPTVDKSDGATGIVSLESILLSLSTAESHVSYIGGEHGVGKSSVAASLVAMWSSRDDTFPYINSFNAVFAVSAFELIDVEGCERNPITKVFGLTSQVYDETVIEKWLIDKKVLVVIDDSHILSLTVMSKIINKLKSSFSDLHLLILGNYVYYCSAPKELCEMCSFVYQLQGLTEEAVFRKSQNCASDKESPQELKDLLKINWNRLGRVLRYPNVLNNVCRMYTDDQSILKGIYSATDLMGAILYWQAETFLEINPKHNPGRRKFNQWLSLACELCFYSLKASLRLEKESLREVESELMELFPSTGEKFIGDLFQRPLCFMCQNYFHVLSSIDKPFLEFLGSQFVLQRLRNKQPMTQILQGVRDATSLILFMGGHLERELGDDPQPSIEDRKIIKALVNHTETSYDDFHFIHQLVAEMKCAKRLVEIVVDETEYNEEWNLRVGEIQQKPMEILLNHVSPTRLIFLADESKTNHELPSVLTYVCRVKISVWLDSTSQFQYGNKEKMDRLLKPFLANKVVPHLDLISGSLSSSMMKELTKSKATQHLVFLRLRVSNLKNLNAILNVPYNLPTLLWLELKIDFDFLSIEDLSDVRRTKVSLFDIHLKGLADTEIPRLAEFLTAIHDRFTGIHLEDTSLTPEAVFALIKGLDKKKALLHAEKPMINRFRHWYYPSVSGMELRKDLTDEEYIGIIGHDDRKYYSDHHVNSSQFITALDAWNLKNYLENHSGIIYFIYETRNIAFTKTLDGTVETTFKGGYREEEAIEKEELEIYY